MTPTDVLIVADQWSAVQFGFSMLANMVAFVAGLLVFQ